MNKVIVRVDPLVLVGDIPMGVVFLINSEKLIDLHALVEVIKWLLKKYKNIISMLFSYETTMLPLSALDSVHVQAAGPYFIEDDTLQFQIGLHMKILFY